MTTTTVDDQLAEAHRRIDVLRARVTAGAGGRALPRIRRHLDALHHEEASVRDAARHAPDEVEEKLGQLTTRLDVAEHALAADVSDDWTEFAAAVEAELDGWDTYLERLQASVAAKAWKARKRAEAAIGDVRTHRIAVGAALAQAHEAGGNTLEGARERVTEARDELGKQADQLSAKLN